MPIISAPQARNLRGEPQTETGRRVAAILARLSEDIRVAAYTTNKSVSRFWATDEVYAAVKASLIALGYAVELGTMYAEPGKGAEWRITITW